MAKIIIDTESDEALEYFAYLLWQADNGSVAGARTNSQEWAKYRFEAGLLFEGLTHPIPTTVYEAAVTGTTSMRRSSFRETYEGIAVLEE